jgi:hypothetical protein
MGPADGVAVVGRADGFFVAVGLGDELFDGVAGAGAEAVAVGEVAEGLGTAPSGASSDPHPANTVAARIGATATQASR